MSIKDLGTVRPGSTIYIEFDSFGASGESLTLTGLAATDVEVYKNGSTTQRASDAGYTLLDTDGIDFDGVTGIHGLSIDLADNTTAGFWEAGAHYRVVISSVTINSQTVSFTAATFRIGYAAAVLNTSIATLSSQTSFTLTAGPAEDDALNGMWAVIHDVASAVQFSKVLILDYTGSTKTVTLAAGATFTAAASDNFSVIDLAPLQPTTTGRTLDVSTGGEAGLDWANVGSQSTSVNLSGTTTNLVNTVTTYTGNTPQTGDAYAVVNSGTHGNAALKTLIDAVDNFVDTEITDIQSRLPAALGANGNIMADIRDVNGTATTPTAAGILEVDITHIGGAALDSTTAQIGVNVVKFGDTAGTFSGGRPEVNTTHAAGTAWLSGAITDATFANNAISAAAWSAGATTEVQAGLLTSLSFFDGIVPLLNYGGWGSTIGDTGNSTTTVHLPTLAHADNDLNGYTLWIRDVSTGLRYYRKITDWVNATALATVDTLPFTPQNDTDEYAVLPPWYTATGFSTHSAADVADAVWDEAIAGHAAAGSTGEALAAAGSAGDPWTTALPGAYSAGQAGYIIGTNINATVSSRATQTSVDAIDDYVDTEIGALTTAVADLPTNAELATALGTADDAVLAAIAALNNLSTSDIDTRLAAIRLDELLSADSDIDGAAPPTVGSIFHELMSKTAGSFTFDQTTDSLEAVRDRGDAAWTTATGFSTHAAADVWSVATRVLTAGTNIALAKGTGVTGFNDLSAADVRTALGMASADLDSQLDAILADTNELQTDWTNGGRLDLIIDAVLADTNELQTDDYPTTLATLATAAELAKVPKSDSNVTWNATALASIQSEANDALVAYDPPTNAEMEARTLVAANYATSAAQTTAQNDLDILTGTDGVTLATSQPNYAPATAAALASLVTTVGAAGAGLTEAGGDGDHLTAINLPDQTMNITGNLSGSVGSVTGAVGSVTGNVGGNVTGSVGSVTGGINTGSGVITTLDALDTAQDTQHSTTQTAIGDVPTNAELAAAIITGLTTALTEGYRGTGATGSVRDLLYELIAHLGNSGITSVTKTLKKLDQSTTAKTFTLDSDTTPTAIEETT